MSGNATKLVFDADGVFLSERPYWNAALGTALDAAGLSDRSRGRWDALADFAFGPLGLQRVTKARGCNSNWDLAAVLVTALDDTTWRSVVDEMLAGDREREAMQTLSVAAESVWQREASSETANGDPLAAAGIDRRGSFYRGVVERYQQVLFGVAGLDWAFERLQLKEDAERTRGVFDALTDDGYVLQVCTGRNHAEVTEPMNHFGLSRWIPGSAITSAADVDRAEEESGTSPLGKPHWFSPACAVAGYPAALDALRGEPLSPAGVDAVYIGDAWADFEAVRAANARGLNVNYIHVRSGVTTREQEHAIRETGNTLGVVDTLEAIPGLLA